tara:strand:- start:1140 stop:1676 length:537 start_codon:yes stop_codon:yes gene_type:complete
MNYIFLLLLIFSSCASLDEDQCKNGNWDIIGRRDGSNGEPLSVLEDHQKACSEYGVKINVSMYKKSRKEGLKQYCTGENGFEVGQSGREYHNVCKSKKFKKNFRIGRKIYSLEKEIDDLEEDNDEYESKIDTASTTEKRYYRSRIRKNKKKIRKAESKLLIIKASIAKSAVDFVDLLD